MLATLRTVREAHNPLRCPAPTMELPAALPCLSCPDPGWIEPCPGVRCWWTLPNDRQPRAAVLLLPEVFGVNAWVRGVAERLAAEGYAALAWPIFWRTAPGLELGYDAAALVEGRRHRDALTADQFLDDATAALAWLQSLPALADRPIGCLGFCFGGHLAMLAATLPGVAASCDCYGARVSTDRPGGGPPTLSVLPEIPGELLCICGDQDPLMPPEEVEAIRTSLKPPHRLLVLAGAGHGFCCDVRPDYRADAAEAAWQAILELFGRRL